MAAGDIRRVRVMTSVWVEHADGEVREHALGASWISGDELTDEKGRERGVGGSMLPIQPSEPLRLLRGEFVGMETIAWHALCERVSRVRDGREP